MSEDLEYIERIAGLIIKYHREELSEEEVLELNVWCAQSTKNQDLFDQLSDPDFVKGSIKALPDLQSLKQHGWEKVIAAVETATPADLPSPVRRNRWTHYAIAAAMLVLLAAGSWMFFRNDAGVHGMMAGPPAAGIQNDIEPGGNKAVLTLSDGSSVHLDSSGTGTIARQADAVVMKSPGIVSYAANTADGKASAMMYNTLTTPAAGQYQVVLPDGSRVWLNNASSLRYPVSFTGKDRVVELHGEAYFEIAKDVVRPFIVQVSDMTVDVLGTSFNITAYSNEAGIKTTLLTGGIRITRGASNVVLNPGEQVMATGTGDLKVVKDVDAEGVIAWKNGLFHFERSDMQTVMRMLARWYDVEVVYEGAVPDRYFGGDIQRNLNLSQVLEILQKNQVHFQLEGKKLTVRP